MTDPIATRYDDAREDLREHLTSGVHSDKEANELMDEFEAATLMRAGQAQNWPLRAEIDAKKDWIPPTPGPTLIYVHTDSETRTLVDRIDWAEADRWASPRELAILGALLRFSLKQLPKGGE